MGTPTRSLVRRALDELKPYLDTFVTQALADARMARALESRDSSALLKAMVQNWEAVFARKLPASARSYVFELKDIRNRWAHEAPFDEDEAQRAVQTARMVAKSIGAPKSLLDTLASLGDPAPATSGSTRPARSVASEAPAPANGASRPRRDAGGVIVHAAELTADDVAMQRVLCPACEEMVFETWPSGWDAHAAHVCKGLKAGTEAERKAAYRARFAQLFRDRGSAAKPARQRDVMRRIVAIHGADEERIVREYAAAERRGEVARASNAFDIPPEQYARALLSDGRKKGWLGRP